MKGKFIVFEGIDGSGTTTQIQLIEKLLKDRGVKVHRTAEPTGGVLGSLIRQILNRRLVTLDGASIDPKVTALLFAADRVDHIQNEITPYIEKGITVLSDRYDLSSFVYQGLFTGDVNWVKEINRYAIEPDLLIYLDIDGDSAFERISNNRVFLDAYEKKELLNSYSKLYKKEFEQYRGKNRVQIDGKLTQDEIFNIIKEKIDKLLF
ncbi:dTMP kinase [bacterium]|nr:dTMP kinase [bacterium]